MDGALAEHVLPSAKGHRNQGSLAAQAALVVETLAAVADAGNQHAVYPALEHGRRREPIDREVEDQQISPQQLVQLLLDIGGERLALRALALFQGIDQILRILAHGEVRGAGHRVPIHRIQVGNLHLMPLGPQRLHGLIAQGSGEGFGLGVGMHEQNIHVDSLKLKGLCSVRTLGLAGKSRTST
ncbi:hypothetical protein FQZ97_1043970 [compost metagenome]